MIAEEERLPVKEGWEKVTTPVKQSDMNHLIFSLISTNPHRGEEASIVGLDTVHAVEHLVDNLLGDFCSVM